ncbi:two-component regulator propeller domain-containing protein [Sphingobacterium sp. ML3W]
MIFQILEDKDGSIWFGTFNGVYRYDGSPFQTLKMKR